MKTDVLQRLADRAEIQDCLARYATAVDRGDWSGVRATYHADAVDQHGEYHGGIDGFIEWLDQRFAGVDNAMHFMGNCLIEFAAADFAFVETYFVSRRLRLPTPAEAARLGLTQVDTVCREVWGRYLDHFERREGSWKVARRQVVVETAYTSIALGGKRDPAAAVNWASRDGKDPARAFRSALFARAGGAAPS